MIGNDHDDNDKTPSPSGSQHMMLNVIYQGITKNFWEDDIFKNLEKNISRSSLNELAIQAPNTAGANGHCAAPGNVSPLVVTRGNAPKAATVLRYFLKIGNS